MKHEIDFQGGKLTLRVNEEFRKVRCDYNMTFDEFDKMKKEFSESDKNKIIVTIEYDAYSKSNDKIPSKQFDATKKSFACNNFTVRLGCKQIEGSNFVHTPPPLIYIEAEANNTNKNMMARSIKKFLSENQVGETTTKNFVQKLLNTEIKKSSFFPGLKSQQKENYSDSDKNNESTDKITFHK